MHMNICVTAGMCFISPHLGIITDLYTRLVSSVRDSKGGGDERMGEEARGALRVGTRKGAWQTIW